MDLFKNENPHPDYYQIPVAVREALMKEEAADRQSRFHDNHDNGSKRRNRKKGTPQIFTLQKLRRS